MRRSTHHHHHQQKIQIDEQGKLQLPPRARLGTRLQKQLGEDPQHQDKWSQYYQQLKQHFKMRDAMGNTQMHQQGYHHHQPVGDFVLGRLGFDVLVRYDEDKKLFYLSKKGVDRLYDLVTKGKMFNIRMTKMADKIADNIANKIAGKIIPLSEHNVLFWFSIYLLMFRTHDSDREQTYSTLLEEALGQVNAFFGPPPIDFKSILDPLHIVSNFMLQPEKYKDKWYKVFTI